MSVVPSFSQNDYPVYAEEALVPAASLVARPAGMEAVTGAAVWMPYVTVYGMVAEIVRLRPGDRVVITAAGNSIGAAAIQVVRALGALPVVTTAVAGQRAELLSAGAAAVIDSAPARGAGRGDPRGHRRVRRRPGAGRRGWAAGRTAGGGLRSGGRR